MSDCGTRRTSSSTTCLNLPNDQRVRLRIRSMVGLIPLFAVETLEPEMLDKLPGFRKRLEWFLNHRPDLAELVSHWQSPGRGERRLLSLLRGHRMKRLLRRMLDESEFLSDYGVRALVACAPRAALRAARSTASTNRCATSPAESESRQFGGNSNWRGPIWFPVEFPDHRIAAEISPLLRQRFQSGVPHGIGQIS